MTSFIFSSCNRPFLILCIFAAFVLPLSSCAKKEEVIQHYSSGEISRKHTEVGGKKEGPMTEYYKDGKVKTVRQFKSDLQVGKTIFYYPGGAIKEAQHYEEGKLHGGDTVFYENGRPQFVRQFNQGALDGYIRKWDREGAMIYEARYSRDTLVEVLGEAVHPDSLSAKYRDE